MEQDSQRESVIVADKEREREYDYDIAEARCDLAIIRYKMYLNEGPI